MLKKVFLFFFFFLIVFTSPTLAQVDTLPWRFPASASRSRAAGCFEFGPNSSKIATLQGIECIFRNLLRVLLPLGGLAAFVIIIAGGFQYLTSAGDPKQAQKAASMITSAIIGIVVVLVIWFLFNLLNALTGLDLLRFEVPS